MNTAQSLFIGLSLLGTHEDQEKNFLQCPQSGGGKSIKLAVAQDSRGVGGRGELDLVYWAQTQAGSSGGGCMLLKDSKHLRSLGPKLKICPVVPSRHMHSSF